jgi:hypothetical protein
MLTDIVKDARICSNFHQNLNNSVVAVFSSLVNSGASMLMKTGIGATQRIGSNALNNTVRAAMLC